MALLFSRLDQLENFRAEDGKFHLKIVYPGLGGRNEWIQTSNPVTESTIEGFQPVQLDYQINGVEDPWAGLGLNAENPKVLISDTPTTFQFYMCIGCQREYLAGTIAGPINPAEIEKQAVTRVELYIFNGKYLSIWDKI